MGRNPNPLEGEGPVVEFADRLRRLRGEAGLTQRTLAAKCHYAPSTISMAEGGKKVPSWEVVQTIVKACGVADLTEWREAWHATQQRDTAQEETTAQELAGDPSGSAAPRQEASGRRWVRAWGVPVIVAVVSSALTWAVALAVLQPHPRAIPTAQATPATTYPVGRDPMPTQACGGTTLGYDCQGKSPRMWGCWDPANAVIGSIKEINTKYGTAYLENWYSKACGTNWARLKMPDSWSARLEIVSREARLCHPADCTTYNTTVPPLYTNMVFGMNSPVTAHAFIKLPSGEQKKVTADTTAG
ncbi:helix-turn-helix domain-containing protein [Nonomuraea sp. NPDC005983]|uniref:helix-turn-helix domain-containing protein n=1 Tax=Nonomuraea sp. NPDC005983 TaxID=3155595 RepID=UPI0033B93FD0